MNPVEGRMAYLRWTAAAKGNSRGRLLRGSFSKVNPEELGCSCFGDQNEAWGHGWETKTVEEGMAHIVNVVMCRNLRQVAEGVVDE